MTLVLLIGSGAREFIIIKKLLDDAKKINERLEIICIKTQENTSINEMCMKVYPMKDNVYEMMTQIEEEEQEEIGFCIIGPEAPLEKQYADYFENQKIPCIGPLQFYAQLETSKHFCRNFLHSDTLLKNIHQNSR